MEEYIEPTLGPGEDKWRNTERVGIQNDLNDVSDIPVQVILDGDPLFRRQFLKASGNSKPIGDKGDGVLKHTVAGFCQYVARPVDSALWGILACVQIVPDFNQLDLVPMFY